MRLERELGGRFALVLEETVRSSSEIHVEGRNLYPPMLRDIASATSSIHINQFGLRPGATGHEFAEALLDEATHEGQSLERMEAEAERDWAAKQP